jgi:hypothetical protein
MSVEQHVALAVRKARLIERIESQRAEIAACVEPFKKPLALADTLVQAGRFVQQRPWVAGAGAFVAVVLARRNLFRWIGRGWALFRGWRFVNRWLHQHGY